MPKVITKDAIERRAYWIGEIAKLSGVFGDDSRRLEEELSAELAKSGGAGLKAHLRLCGDIPEQYSHDSSEEKLYSKYTDCLLAETYKFIGLKSLVLSERADAADVEAFGEDYSFVADAKAFRLSRTAKNQKDFKVTAMDTWKRGKPFAMVVCPIYQLPNRSSQIYLQATTRDVCIFTYSHLSLIVSATEKFDHSVAQTLLTTVFGTVSHLNPSKDATEYWTSLNRAILSAQNGMKDLWKDEKLAAAEGLEISKSLALEFLASERERIMRMTHDQALGELIRVQRIDSRIKTISAVSDNNIIGMV